MNANQRAARYVLAHLLTRIEEMNSIEMQTAAREADGEIMEHVQENIDWPLVYPLVRRYAESLSTEFGFEAEQGVKALSPLDLDRPHYTDNEYGWETKEKAESRLRLYSPAAFVDCNAETGRYVIRW